MRNPYGKECKYFYGNYYRGREDEECRLIGHQQPPHNWTPDLCENCPVPGILLANACETMVLEGEVERFLFGFKRRMKISAYCTKTNQVVENPKIGCGECHKLPMEFRVFEGEE